jgi:biotin carboxyl carrier protein
MKKLRITIEGKVYEVTVEVLDEGGTPVRTSATPAPVGQTYTAPAAVSPPPSTSRAAASVAAAGDIPSPLAGKVVAVSATVGQQVNAGDELATIEAMKMNTYIYAPGAGTVTAVYVSAGDGVEEGQPLVKLE